MPVVPAIILIYTLTICVVFFSFFTTKIAQMKLRNAGWGILGALLGPIGMLLVCYLPSRRKDGKETNPIHSGIRALPGLSRKIFLVLFALLILGLVGLYLATSMPKWRENANYEQSIDAEIKQKLSYASTVEGKISSVAVGSDTTYAITADGKLYTWGYNNLSLTQQDKGAAAEDAAGVAQIGREVYLLKKNHKLYRIDETGKQTEFATGVEKVVGGAQFGAYLKTSGDVYVWGDNAFAQLGHEGEDSEKPLWLSGSAKDISAGGRHLLILKKDGAVFGCGSNITGALGLKDAAASVPLRQIATGCKGIAAGTDFSLVLGSDGVLKSSGANECGQLGRETEENKPGFEKVETGVTLCGAGGKSGWYISENDLYTFGANYCGKLGNGSTENSVKPEKVLGNVSMAAMSYDHTVAVSDEKLFVWGDNSYGQLGRAGEKHLVPTAVVSVRG